MKARVTQEDERWDVGWEEHKQRQLQRLARLPLSEKLDWLEEAQQLAATLLAQANDNPDKKANSC